MRCTFLFRLISPSSEPADSAASRDTPCRGLVAFFRRIGLVLRTLRAAGAVRGRPDARGGAFAVVWPRASVVVGVGICIPVPLLLYRRLRSLCHCRPLLFSEKDEWSLRACQLARTAATGLSHPSKDTVFASSGVSSGPVKFPSNYFFFCCCCGGRTSLRCY